MRGFMTFSVVLVFCVVLSVESQESPDGAYESDPASLSEPNAVTMTLTGFDVNDAILGLHYRIKNGSDHDVWVCRGLGRCDRPDLKSPEVYLDRDRRTLVIRQRIEVPTSSITVSTPAVVLYAGQFIRLAPGQERRESLLLDLPVQREILFTDFGDRQQGPGQAGRLALEVGFFDGDLPGTIRAVLEVANKLRCADLTYADIGYENMETFLCYFRGLNLQDAFAASSIFDSLWSEGEDEILIPYQWPTPVIGERFLKVSIEGVDIAYR